MWDAAFAIEEQARQLSRHFKVSTVVIARRAVELNLSDWQQFLRSMLKNGRRGNTCVNRRRGDFYRTSALRNSKTLTKAVLATTFEGKLLLRDAGHILGVAPSKLKQLASTVYGK